VSFVAGCIVF
jgi:hypothetical protein